ncbi:hypothetical protein U9M48_044509 [Paspalum notatum var. saurae]|uniref:40S ribosomal protein S15 n=1 Tax=Paspalum notatum var. saurae TaxID=547442 RepID=A0AAQ3XIL5_PASNO
MADVEAEVAAGGQPKKRTFRKYSYRGVDLDALLDMSTDDLVQLFPARARRRFQRGLKRKPMALIKRLRKAVMHSLPLRFRFIVSLATLLIAYCKFNAGMPECTCISSGSLAGRNEMVLFSFSMFWHNTLKKEAPAGEKPEAVRTHLRNMIIVPEMIGSIIGVYNGKTFNQVEIKPEMIGHYLAEFSISYKPVKHGRPGIGATHSSRFIPLK